MIILFYASGQCHQNSNQWQCSIIVNWLCLYHQYTALPLKGVLVMWYGRITYINTFWYNFDSVLCQFLETGTSDICLIGIVQLLRFSGFSLYPLSFFRHSPLKSVHWAIKNFKRGIKYELNHSSFFSQFKQIKQS